MNADRLEVSLRNAGLRVTSQRLAVLRALEDRVDAVTAQDLHQQLRGRRQSPGLATVYRTLTALAEADEVDTFPRDGEVAYRLCGDKHHHHLVCEKCGSVEEVEGAELEAWIKTIARKRGFVVTGHTADIFGRCRNCR